MIQNSIFVDKDPIDFTFSTYSLFGVSNEKTRVECGLIS